MRQEQILSKDSIKEDFTRLHTLELICVKDESHQVKEEIQYKKPVNDLDITILSKKMNALAMAMENLSREGREVASEQMVLQALFFSGIQSRHDSVKQAHPNTFTWIFDRSVVKGHSRLHYRECLECSSGTYWISGKPGSGKSTFQKFLYHHDDIERLLRSWAGSKRLVRANYFFWNAGTKLQKSQEGLLRSLLFEIFRRAPDLIARVWKPLNQLGPYPRDPDPWTREELLECFWKLSDVGTTDVRFCLFVDGLDEYNVSPEGSYRELAQLLNRMSSCPDIKLCLSSRPENDFVDAFGQS